MPDLKAEAHRLVDSLPDEATWDDLMYCLYVHQEIERGVVDGDAGRTIPVVEVRERLGILSERRGDS